MEGLETIADLIRWGASRFRAAGLHFGHGTDNAIDEALVLVLHALHLEQPLPAELFNARLTTTEKDEIDRLFGRRIDERVPAAYLTGEARFCGLKFKVDEHVLIPRSPIAELIEAGFEPWQDPAEIRSLLDLCTGSGCIGIASSVHLPDAEVVVTDISEDALKLARQNVRLNSVEDRVTVLNSNVFDTLGQRRFDVIVSNPPYVPRCEFEALPEEFEHEPGLALLAGEDGLDLVRKIIEGAGDHLSEAGILVVEVGSAAAALVDAFPDLPFTWPTFERGGDGVFILTAEQLGAGG
ncbi:MAG: 50S ribosomal protein L3 N(5)-glutamine methyltransferase [Gammaproteobacteria bacterium]